jgi:hypothetical protein
MKLFFKRKDDGNGYIDMVNGRDINELYNEAWDAVDPNVKEKAIQILDGLLTSLDKEIVVQEYEAYGPHEWLYSDTFGPNWHHSGGMAVRNALRGGGLPDAVLPPFDAYYGDGTDVRNWDDYYVQAVEAACGLRT